MLHNAAIFKSPFFAKTKQFQGAVKQYDLFPIWTYNGTWKYIIA